jgi:septal ring factor EnvC (AmiA/AmiB activator)
MGAPLHKLLKLTAAPRRVLQRATVNFPSDAALADQTDFVAALDKLSQDQRHGLEQLDREAMRLLPAIDSQRLTYARARRRAAGAAQQAAEADGRTSS